MYRYTLQEGENVSIEEVENGKPVGIHPMLLRLDTLDDAVTEMLDVNQSVLAFKNVYVLERVVVDHAKLGTLASFDRGLLPGCRLYCRSRGRYGYFSWDAASPSDRSFVSTLMDLPPCARKAFNKSQDACCLAFLDDQLVYVEYPNEDPDVFEPGPESGETDELSVAQEAHNTIHGDRMETYGAPVDNFARCRNLCRATGRPHLAEITSEDLAVIMICIKLARDTNRPKRDNCVDGAAYFDILHQVRGE